MVVVVVVVVVEIWKGSLQVEVVLVQGVRWMCSTVCSPTLQCHLVTEAARMLCTVAFKAVALQQQACTQKRGCP
jgi:hypothetical protein